MSLFSDLERRVSSAVDQTMGERIRLEPMKRGEVFAAAADGKREPITVTAVIDFNPATAQVHVQSTYHGFEPKLAGDQIHVSIALSAFQSAAQYPQANDVIVALERPGMPKSRLTRSPDHDGIGRMVCVCGPAYFRVWWLDRAAVRRPAPLLWRRPS